MKYTAILILSIFSLAFGDQMQHPFDYDLHFSRLQGNHHRTLICFHGYGDNHEMTLELRKCHYLETTLISFDFPDPKKMAYGTIQELLPALYVMKQVVVDQGVGVIDLYGFSAGGGALVNAIGILNTDKFEKELKSIGIGAAEKSKLLSAIQKGIVILDSPLKSIEEIIDFRGSTEELEILAQNYRENNLIPLNSLKRLQGLSLDILLNFQENDEILSNRDDQTYIEMLKKSSPTSKVTTVIGQERGHNAPHTSVWRLYSQKINDLKFMNTTEGTIALTDTGGKGFPLVLVHGNSCSSEVFKKQIAYFRNQYRIIAIDFPGHGKSDNAKVPDNAYNIPGYAKILDEVMTNLKLSQFAVVGFSLGGNIALQWAEITDRINGIMMVSSAPMKYSEEAFKAYPPYEGSYAASPDQLTENQAIQYMNAGRFKTEDPDVYFMIRDAMRTDGTARAKMVASVLGGKGTDETDIVSRLSVPLAVVIGKNDTCVGIDYIHHLSYHNLWHQKIHLLDAQHAIVLHQDDQLNPLLGDFLKELR